MVKSLGIIIALMGLVALVSVSCATKDIPAGQSFIEVTDQLGRAVTLEQAPQRIVSLAPSNTELLFALGLGDRIVGVTKYCNYPPEAGEKEKVGGFSTPDIEKVVSLDPDLVVATSIHETEVIPDLESRGIPVLALDPKTIEQVIQTIELAGKATGTEATARQLVESMQKRLKTVSDLVAELSPDERSAVLYVLWHDPLMTIGHDTLQNEVISLAGGKNIFDELSGYPKVDLESVIERQPQVIIAGTGHGSGGKAPLDWVKSEPRLKDTEALIQNKITEINADIASRPGPRIVDAVEDMLRLIHPDLAEKLGK